MHLKRTEDGRKTWIGSDADKLRSGVTGHSSNGKGTVTFRTDHGSIRTRGIDEEDRALYMRMPIIGGILLIAASLGPVPATNTTSIEFWVLSGITFLVIGWKAMENEFKLPWFETLLVCAVGWMLDTRLGNPAKAAAFLYGVPVYLWAAATLVALLVFFGNWAMKGVWERFVSGVIFAGSFWFLGFSHQNDFWISPLLLAAGLFSFLCAGSIWSDSTKYMRGMNNLREH